MHPLQFTGAEVQPALSGSAIVLEQGGGGSGIWASHPSAIGYRRQGYVTGGSHGGSGSMTVTIAAVAPEFDSGMNQGTDQDETERLLNFSQGAEENPTVAQSQPVSRAQEQVSGISSGAGGPSLDGMMDPSNDNPPWRAGANPFSGHGYYSPFQGWFGWPGGGAGAGGAGGIVNAPAQTPNPVSMKMYPISPGLSPGQTGPSPPSRPPLYPPGYEPGPGPGSGWDNSNPSPASPDPAQPPGPSPGVSSPTGSVGQAPGAQINPAQPTDGSAIIGADDHYEGGNSWGDPEDGGGGGALDYASNAAQQVFYGNYTPDNQRNLAGTAGEIAVGFVPIVSTVASGRDLFYDVTNWKWEVGHGR
jgi:hypothetical protein